MSRSALHWAALSGHSDVLRLLLDHGCDPGARDHAGDTALQLAAWGCHLSVSGASLLYTFGST